MIEVLRNIIVFLRVMSFRIKSLSEEEFRRLQECVKANPEKSVPELTKLLYEEFNRDNSKNPVLQTTIQHWVSMFHLQR